MITITASKLLAFAVWRLFPSAKLHGGYADETGFCYDFHLEQPINDEMLALIETEMVMLGKERQLQAKEMMRENAAELFQHLDQPYLADLALEQEWNVIPLVQMEKMYDFFQGEPEYGFYKLLKANRIDERTRIYGIAAKSKKELKALEKRDEVDHREIAKEKRLFTHHEELPSGSIFWLPKGAFLKKTIENWFYEEHLRQGFTPVFSPKIAQDRLLKSQGVKPEGFIQYNGEAYPMPPPLHELAFKTEFYSYRDLPIRYAELYDSYRVDSHKPGLYSALPQTRDTAHIFCAQEQVAEELISSLQFMSKIIKMFDFEHRVLLQVSNQKNDTMFEEWLRKALEITNPSYDEERVPDGSAIVLRPVGMKLSLQHGKKLHYQGVDDEMHKPVVLSRTLFGSIERLIALIIENCQGNLPFWLSLEQVRVLNINEPQADYAKAVQNKLQAQGIRAKTDYRNETLAAKIHMAEKEKVPVIVVVGDKEMNTETVALRTEGQVQKGVKLEALIAELQQNIGRKLES